MVGYSGYGAQTGARDGLRRLEGLPSDGMVIYTKGAPDGSEEMYADLHR